MMKKITTYFVRCGLLALSIAVLGGCGDARSIFVDCVYDSECAGDGYCIVGQCAMACSQDEDCGRGVSCETYQRTGEADPIQACFEGEPEGGSVECSGDPICRDTFNDPAAYCGLHNRCVQPGEEEEEENPGDTDGDPDPDGEPNIDGPYQYIIIEQLNADGTVFSAAETGDPPEEEEPVEEEEVWPLRVGAVLARNAQGTAEGYGQVLRIESEGDAYGELTETHIPLDEEGICLEEPRGANYVSLGGPGDRVVVALLGGTGDLLILEDDWRLEIFGESAQCLLGPPHEAGVHRSLGEYRVLFCVSDDEVTDEEADCPIEVDGPLSGFSDLEVTFEP